MHLHCNMIIGRLCLLAERWRDLGMFTIFVIVMATPSYYLTSLNQHISQESPHQVC